MGRIHNYPNSKHGPDKKRLTARSRYHLTVQTGVCIASTDRPLLNVRFEVVTAVTMKNAVYWDIRTQFIPHRRHITSPLQSPAG
jgi:hypothetical protein